MFRKASLIIYKQKPAVIQAIEDKISISFVSGFKGKKALIENQKVRDKDILFLHPGPAENLANLVTEDNIKASDTFTKAIIETWELLDEEDQQAFRFDEIAELSIDTKVLENIFPLYFSLIDSVYFKTEQKESQLFFTARSKDEVAALLEKENEKQNEAAIKDAFIKRLRKKNVDLESDAKFLQEIEAFALGKTDKPKYLKEAHVKETIEEAHKLLLDVGFWTMSKNPYPTRHGLSMHSSTSFLDSPPHEDDRIKLEHLAYAIDNEGSTDPDDAIAYDGEHLWIHIADPASTVLPDSAIDKAARNRGATLYIPEGASRMLSEKSLKDYALGLEGENSYSRALSFKIRITEDAAIEDISILKSFVKVKRLSYKEADEQKNSSQLAPLFHLAEKNFIKRKNAGAIQIQFPEASVVLKKNEGADPSVEITALVEYESFALVREMMLLAGEAAARFAFKNNIPFPYVSQEEPDIPKKLPDGLAGQYRLRKSMKARSLGVTPSQHASLGLSFYSQVSSPLRRYSDLVAHQQIRLFLDNKTVLTGDAVLERISQGDAASRAIMRASRESELHWKLVYLLQNPEWEGRGIILEQKGKTAIVFIESLAMEASVHAPKAELNDEIFLRVGKIQLTKLEVQFIEA